ELGSNIVSVPQLYGTTYTLFGHVLPSQGVTVRFAASDRPEAIAALIDDQTRAVFCESVGNPAGNICDIEALARVAHAHGVPLIVDNTVATPILLKPIDYGADIVVHSLTKFLGGHGTTLGCIIVDSGKFPWREHADRFPMFNRPDASYHGLIYVEHFKEAAYIARCRSVYQRTTGAVLPPLSAFLLLQGIETVALRVERHVENARRVAEFLRADARVAWVNYAGFPDSPYHALAQRYLGGRACSLFTFGIKGGFEASKKFYDALGLVNHMPDAGLQATDRQFVALRGAAADGLTVRVTPYALPDIPRTDWGRAYVTRFYSPIEDLWDSHLDGLIVTGTEPRSPNLREEPYWASLTRVLEWAEHNTHSAVWSCLATHAALLHLDGIDRRPLGEKRFGIFECDRVSDHPLTADAPARLRMPHSRWNDIPEDALTSCVYRVLTRSDAAGVDAFVKQRKSLFVFFQGHPEYEAHTLML